MTVAELPDGDGAQGAGEAAGATGAAALRGVTVPRVKPAGKVSARLTPAASDGPPLETVIV